jgi:hypothetical protein
MPHVCFVSGSQAPGLPGPLEQHRKHHVPLQTQTPLTQAFSLATQSAHCTPFTPQDLSALAWHVPGCPGPLEQQPFGQLAALQTQTSFAQTAPAGQQAPLQHCPAQLVPGCPFGWTM